MKTHTAALLAGLVVISAMTAVSAASDRTLHTAKKPSIQTGIDRLLKNYKQELEGKRVGLITNPTGVNASLKSSVDVLYEAPDIHLTALFTRARCPRRCSGRRQSHILYRRKNRASRLQPIRGNEETDA